MNELLLGTQVKVPNFRPGVVYLFTSFDGDNEIRQQDVYRFLKRQSNFYEFMLLRYKLAGATKYTKNNNVITSVFNEQTLNNFYITEERGTLGPNAIAAGSRIKRPLKILTKRMLRKKRNTKRRHNSRINFK